MYQKILLSIVSITISVIIIPYFCFSNRGVISFLIFASIYLVLSLLFGYAKKIKFWSNFLILTLPIQIILQIPIIGNILYPNAHFSTTMLYEYVPLNLITSFIGLKIQHELSNQKIRNGLSIITIYTSSIALIFVFLPNYYFYIYSLEKVSPKWKLPDEVELLELDKEIFDSKKLRNKIVVLDFWSTGCGSCIHQMAEMIKIENRYKNDTNIVFLSVNQSLHDKFGDFIKAKHIQMYKDKLHFVYDKNAHLAKAFNVEGVPDLYLIDKKGKVTHKIGGFSDNEDNFAQNLSYEIDKLIKQ
jgi:thiol-disulfide isomerase/thioredoxin